MNELVKNPTNLKITQFINDWEKLKEGFPYLGELNSHDDNPGNQQELLQEKLRFCINSGGSIQDPTKRTQLQWIARGIGDYIFELYGIYSATTILPFIENPQENPQAFHNIPYPRNPYFTGRDQELDQIYSFFVASKSNDICSLALVGMGGIGKTQLAIEYAYRYKDQYSAIYCFQADDRDLLLYSIAEVAEQLIPKQSNHNNPKIVAKNFKHYLETQSGWLLIVDNADDYSIVKEFLPKSGDGCILITTRSSQLDSTINQIVISPLLPNESKLLLLRRAEQLKHIADLSQIKPEEIGMAEELIKQLGMLPLAIDQAGAYIGKEKITIEEYLTRYKEAEQGKQLRQTQGELSRENISSFYTLNLEQVAFRDPEAAELIRVCAFLAPEAIPKKIFTENPHIWEGRLATRLQKTLGFDKLCQEATRYSLVQWEPEKQLLSIHSVVQQVIRDQLNEEEQKSYIRKVIEGVNAIFPEEIEIRFGSKDILRTCDRLSSQGGKVLEWTKDQSITILAVGHLMNKLSCYFVLRSRYSEATNICEKSNLFWKNLSASKDLLDTNKKETDLGKANSLNNFAELNHIEGNYQKAKELFDEALDIRRNELNSDDPDYYLFGQSLHNLARLETDLGHYSNAEKHYRQALKINEEIQTEDLHFLLARSYNDLAKLYFLQAKYEEAENNYQEALTINKEILEKNHPNIASNLDNLGDVYMAQTRYSEAELKYLEALEIRKDYYRGEDYLAIADSYTSLAWLYRKIKNYEKAKSYYYQALGIQRKLFEKKDHPDIATSYNNLALLYQEQGFNEEAEQYYIDALGTYKKAFGEAHSTVATTYNNLALFYHKQGNYSEAEKSYKKSLDIYKKIVNENHPLIANCLDNLKLLYQEQERYEKAESLFKEALESKRKISNEDDLDVADSLDNLALLSQEQKRYEEAESLFKEALELRRQILNEDDLDIAYSRDNLALLYQEQERYEEAESLFKEALELRRQILGEDDLDIADSLDNLALLYQEQENYEDAEPLFIQALALRKRILEEEEPDIAYSIDNLALLYQEGERYDKAEPLFLESLALRRKHLEEDHPDITYSLDNLALLYQDQERYQEAAELLNQLLKTLEKDPDSDDDPYIANLKYRLTQLISKF
jgi:tetratricopeptide (TPR) repeat protein